jgi:hypothetical protein
LDTAMYAFVQAVSQALHGVGPRVQWGAPYLAENFKANVISCNINLHAFRSFVEHRAVPQRTFHGKKWSQISARDPLFFSVKFGKN